MTGSRTQVDALGADELGRSKMGAHVRYSLGRSAIRHAAGRRRGCRGRFKCNTVRLRLCVKRTVLGLSGMTFFFYYQLFAVMAFIQGLSRAFVTSRDSHFLAAIPSKERDFAEKLMHRFLHLTRARKNVLWIAPLDLRHGVRDQLLKHGQLNV